LGAEPTHHHVPLPAFEELVARLTEEVALHGLGAVRGEPGRIVAGRAPTARVEGRPPIADPEQCEGTGLDGVQRVRLAGPRPDEDAGLDARFRDVGSERLDRGAPDGHLLSPAGDQDPPLPPGPADYAFEFKEIAPLGLGERGAPMDAERRHLEPDLAELAYRENLEGLGRQLRQLQPRSTSPSAPRSRLYGRSPGAASPRGCALRKRSLYHPSCVVTLPLPVLPSCFTTSSWLRARNPTPEQR